MYLFIVAFYFLESVTKSTKMKGTKLTGRQNLDTVFDLVFNKVSISIFARNKFSLAIYVLRVAITWRYFEFLCFCLQKNDNVMKNAMGLTEYPNQVNVKEEDTYNLELKPTSLYQMIR